MAQGGLELLAHQPSPPKCWNYRMEPLWRHMWAQSCQPRCVSEQKPHTDLELTSHANVNDMHSGASAGEGM